MPRRLIGRGHEVLRAGAVVRVDCRRRCLVAGAAACPPHGDAEGNVPCSTLHRVVEPGVGERPPRLIVRFNSPTLEHAVAAVLETAA